MNTIDFLPEKIRLRRNRKKRLVHQVYVLLGCAALLGLWGYTREIRVQKAQAELAELQDRSVEIQKQLSLREELERQQAKLMVVQQIEKDLGSRADVLDVLGELEAIMPESIALSTCLLETVEIRVEKKEKNTRSRRLQSASGKPAEPETIKRVRGMITGISPSDVDIANFIGQLSASPLFQEVNMGYARNVEFRGRQGREFQASFYISR